MTVINFGAELYTPYLPISFKIETLGMNQCRSKIPVGAKLLSS